MPRAERHSEVVERIEMSGSARRTYDPVRIRLINPRKPDFLPAHDPRDLREGRARGTRAPQGPSALSIWFGKVWKQLAIYTNWPALAAIFVLTAIGIVSIWADPRADASKQLKFLAIAILCMTLFQAA